MLYECFRFGSISQLEDEVLPRANLVDDERRSL
jgi:hypothetical protein